MLKITLSTSLFVAIIILLSPSSNAANKGKTMQEILEASTPNDWRSVDPDNTIYLELASGRVVIELAPQFAPEHTANIRTLATEGYWDDLSINRSQDNFVVQWGDAAEEPKLLKSLGNAKTKLPAEFAINRLNRKKFHAIPDNDGWSKRAGFVQGFPAATDGNHTWLTHCYATVGAGRGNAPDSSLGTELYVVIGQSPRQLDRNITVVGRVLQGMEHLSVLARGTGPLGFYEKAEQRTRIKAIHLASKVAENKRTNLEVFRTDTKTFDALVEARRNRKDDWYLNKAGHIDICNVPIPVRIKP
jgi:peptidylprolyl isomerase